MPVDSAAVGLDLPPMEIELTVRRALAFAAALGETGEALDDASPHFTALPTLCASLEWAWTISGRNAALGLSPLEARRGVHAGQDTRFLAPLRPGRTYVVEGRIVSARGSSAGTVVATHLDIRDRASGAAVTSTLTTAMFRGVALTGGDRVADHPGPLQAGPGSDDGISWEETTVPLDRGFAHRYSECADIWNPIHTERTVAHAAGLSDIIVHGTALWALAGKVVADRFAHGDLSRLRRLSGRFSAMVGAGEPITVRDSAAVDNPRAVVFSVLNAQGAEAISRGWAEFHRD